jgi:hypothetical protein
MENNDKASPSPAPAKKPAKAPPVTATPEKKKKSKKPLIITLIIVGGVLLLAGVGFMIWYFAYYSSNDKVLNDAFHNSLSITEGTGKTKLTVKAVGDATTTPDMNIEANIKTSYNQDIMALDIDGKLSASIMSISISANLVITMDGNLYIKVNNLDGLLSQLGVSSDSLGFDISKISDKWLKLSGGDISKWLQESANVSEEVLAEYWQCTLDLEQRLADERDFQTDLLNAIKSSNFLQVKRVGQDKDGVKFQLSADLDHFVDLITATADSDYGAANNKCNQWLGDSSRLPTASERTEITAQLKEMLKGVDMDTKVYFWVSPWGHQPTRLQVNVKMSKPANVDITLDSTSKSGKPKLTVPSDSTDLTTIIKDIQSPFTNYPFTNPYNDIMDYDYDYDDLYYSI